MIRFPESAVLRLGEGVGAKAKRLVDEDRVDFAVDPRGSSLTAVRASVRSTSGERYELFFDSLGGACSCQASASGRVCSHLAAAMIAYEEWVKGRRDGV